MRLKLFERLVSVKNETAMLTTFNEVNMTPIMDIRKKYKEIFKTKYGSGKSPYKGNKPKLTGLTRWFKEEWKSDTGKTGYTSKSSVYRPTKRITSQTPKTFDELSTRDIQRAKSKKRTKGRVDKF